MSDLHKAADTSTRAGLVKALERAAAGGRTSTAETLLGAIAGRFPRESTAEAIRALNRAVHCRQWATAAYLADFLADTAPPRPVSGGRTAPSENIDEEVLRCLADHRRVHREVTPDEPFLLTDAIEDRCMERGIGFARSVAIVDCAAQGVPPADRLECAREAVARDDAGPAEGGAAGGAITFEHVDPDLPPEAYGGANNPCRHFSLAEPERSAATLRGKDDFVLPAGVLTLELGFPPEVAGTYAVGTSGTRGDVARAVAEKYGELLAAGDSGYVLADIDLERVVPKVGEERRAAVEVIA